MEYCCGIDVSLEQSSVCVVDAEVSIVREATVASDPDMLIAWFSDLDLPLSRIGLEAGPLSQWLYAGVAKAGFAVELLETRHVRDAFKAMPIKTDRKDAQGIAQLMRLGWFRPVHCKSLPAQEVRAMLTARKLVQTKLHDVPVCRSAAPKIRYDGPDLRRDAAAGGDVEMSLRGLLRGFSLKVGHTTPRTFEPRLRELVEGHPTLTTIADALLAARSVLHREFQGFERRVRSLARRDDRARLLMSAPGVGLLVSLPYASAIDDPARFKRSKQVGAHFGLTPKRYQSGEKDVSGRISKIGDRGVRAALYEAAHIILTRPVKAGALKSWPMRLAARAGKNKAKVALARKLAVILHRMLVDGTPFALDKAAMAKGWTTRRYRVRATHHPPEVRSRRRDGGSGQAEKCSVASKDDYAFLDRSTCRHLIPSGGGHAPTTDRRESSAAGQKLKMRVDQSTPVTEEHFSTKRSRNRPSPPPNHPKGTLVSGAKLDFVGARERDGSE